MTIEIKQLIIRAVVEGRREPAAAAPAAPPSPLPEVRRARPALTGADREALIAECARQVLRELRKGRGR